jgi:hypothetical protein
VLFSPDAHEPIVQISWNDARTRDAIRTIAADADSALDPEGLTDLYDGAAGVLWALDTLQRRGYVDVQSDLAEASRRALERHRARPDYAEWDVALPPQAQSSLVSGEAGVLLVAWQLDRDEELADALHALVLANVGNETNEWMWGPPGSMLAARAMHGWTGDARWDEAWHACAEDVWSRWGDDGVWEVDLYGHATRALGPAHGFAGNVFALMQGGERLEEIGARASATLAREAIWEDGLATWPPLAGGEIVSPRGEVRLQWCHGAPGIVASVGELLDEELLLAAAELTWQAGGLRKGPGLCHGTAGNGYALLKAFACTGDESWLDRARRFALHALAQVESLPPSYSLFTGGIGAALFAASCVEARYDFPTLDSF